MSQAQNQQGDEGGILKAYWISKILEHIPSCLVLLYDWTKPELSELRVSFHSSVFMFERMHRTSCFK